MRDHYAGDLSDFLKLSFLRALVRDDRKLGVAWYYVSGVDNSKDGNHLAWRGETRWHGLDEEVRERLGTLSNRTVAELERLPIWPKGTSFHREALDSFRDRPRWIASKHFALAGSQVIFFDPDNGVRHKPSVKHATYDEIRDLLTTGRSIVFITFPKRIKHDVQVAELHRQIVLRTGADLVFTLRISVCVRNKGNTCYTPTFRWFTIVNADEELVERGRRFASSLRGIERLKVSCDEHRS